MEAAQNSLHDQSLYPSSNFCCEFVEIVSDSLILLIAQQFRRVLFVNFLLLPIIQDMTDEQNRFTGDISLLRPSASSISELQIPGSF